MLTLIFISVFSITAFLTFSILNSAEDRINYRNSLKKLSKYEVGVYSSELNKTFFERVVKPGLDKFLKKISAILPSTTIEHLDVLLRFVGNPLGLDARNFMGAKLMMGILTALTALIASFTLKFSLNETILFLITIFFAGYQAPQIWLNLKASKKRAQIRKELPDVIDLLVICLEAGLGFDAALSKIVKGSNSALSREIAKTLYEIKTGVSRKEAFENLYRRSQVDELRRLSTAITQSEMFGVSVSSALRAYAEELRTVRRQKAEENAQKIGVKVTFPLILCIFPAMFVVILGPALIRLFSEF
jgi:tight adherence protein C